jgi:hypothetical protein
MEVAERKKLGAQANRIKIRVNRGFDFKKRRVVSVGAKKPIDITAPGVKYHPWP